MTPVHTIEIGHLHRDPAAIASLPRAVLPKTQRGEPCRPVAFTPVAEGFNCRLITPLNFICGKSVLKIKFAI